jgi:hypothetical protein
MTQYINREPVGGTEGWAIAEWYSNGSWALSVYTVRRTRAEAISAYEAGLPGYYRTAVRRKEARAVRCAVRPMIHPDVR